ncbi:MAG: hypothetical protein CMI90_00660 [Pelagibacteraceae bacterium]|nr:hypothetical protein [Pelagibacteraceae bacterium]
MVDWKNYGPIYSVAPGIKKLGSLPIIEFDDQEERYLNLKKKSRDNVFFDPLFDKKMDVKITLKIQSILKNEYPKKKISV